jgi:hypothetical protein
VSTARSGRTAVAALSAVVASLTLGSGPAFAHGGTTIPDAAYYRTELTAVTPQPAGVSARVDPGGEWVEVTNRGPAVVVVLGYLGEPYLRLGSGGVDENQVSPSTYLNRSLFADSVPSGDQAAGVAPVWRSTGSGASVQWHDHRIHWMGQARPPVVDKDPAHPHEIGTWVVHATADGSPFDIHGTLRWIGKPGSNLPIAPWQIAVGNTVVLGGGVVVFWCLSRRRRPVGRATAPAS